jgi:hypothetical protein
MTSEEGQAIHINTAEDKRAYVRIEDVYGY